MTDAKTSLEVKDLGRMGYVAAVAVQHHTHEAVLGGDQPGTLLLVEHDPVITVSQRKSATTHLLADAATLQRLGIDVQATDRGGDITYHGPGQLVIYPILRLADYRLSLGRYMRLLEDAVIAAVASWGVTAYRIDGCTGVWVGGQESGVRGQGSGVRSCPSMEGGEAIPAKLCAMGVRLRRGVTLHGLALNVTTDLSHFQTIVPCGLVGRGVTSLAALLGRRCPSMSDVKATLISELRRHLAACH